MCARSASVNAVIEKWVRDDFGQTVCSSRRCEKVVSDPTPTLLAHALRRRLDFLERVPEVGNVLKAAVHGSEADVADLVERVELLHDHLADAPRRDLALAERQHLRDDAIDGLIDEFRGHRTLVQRAPETFAHPRHVEIRACPVGLDDLRQPQLDRLVRREPLLAARAPASPADRAPRLRNARVDDLRIGVAAERALHSR